MLSGHSYYSRFITRITEFTFDVDVAFKNNVVKVNLNSFMKRKFSDKMKRGDNLQYLPENIEKHTI